MAKFVLVHGGLHGAWCWEKLAPYLRARGHEVLAIDLPGLGDDPTPPEQTTLSDYGDAVAQAARAIGGDAIVVGHSLGGMAISDGAEKAPDAMAKLVYLAAILLPDGARIDHAGIQLDPSMAPDGVAPVLPREICAAMFYNDCTDADIDFAMPRLRPQATAAMQATMRVSDANWGRVPRYYIACERDGALNYDRQRAMAEGSPVRRTITLDSDHSPFFSMPDRLAAVLHEIAADA